MSKGMSGLLIQLLRPRLRRRAADAPLVVGVIDDVARNADGSVTVRGVIRPPVPAGRDA